MSPVVRRLVGGDDKGRCDVWTITAKKVVNAIVRATEKMRIGEHEQVALA